MSRPRTRRKGQSPQGGPSLFDAAELDALSMNLTPPPPELPSQDALLDEMRGDEKARRSTERLMVMSMGSGSSGNCYYMGSREEGVLIDAGVDDKAVINALHTHGIPLEAIQGILITHDHGDHVRYLYAMLKRLGKVSFFCTPRTLKGMLERHNLPRRLRDYHQVIYKEFEKRLGQYLVATPFEVSHDGTENVGYHIAFGPYHRLTLVTDTGYVTERAAYYLQRAQHIIIESNYDNRMLDVGPYPEYLKDRIRSQRGHLSNDDASAFVANILPPPQHILLCHLSQDNNTPQIAFDTMAEALRAEGLQVTGYDDAPSADTTAIRLAPLPRTTPSPLYVFHARG